MSSDLPALEALHADVDARCATLAQRHEKRLRCRRGCSDCCVDDLTVFEVEADLIRARHAELLERGTPGPRGACAFLGPDGDCRIYPSRPYACRTQGLPLRWLSEDDGSVTEQRDICPLNEDGEPVELLPSGECWTIGPVEERLRALQAERNGGELRRVALRDLFGQDGASALSE